MTTQNVNNNSKINLHSYKVGLKKSTLTNDAQKSLFAALDKNNDGVINKNEIKGIVKGKLKGNNGKTVEKEYIKVKDLPENRSLVIDENGKEWVMAHDGTILKSSYAAEQKGVPQNIVNEGRQEKAAEQRAKAERQQNLKVQKQSAKQIVSDLKSAIKGLNDNNAIKKALNKIDNPDEMKEVNRLLEAEGFKGDDLYSPLEKFMYKELKESSIMYNSFELLEDKVQGWISNGTLKGQDAINAQARMAARVICDGGDGLGTNCDKIKKGIKMIKSPDGSPQGAKAVYDKVNKIIANHSTFYGIGAKSKDLMDYLDGEMWDGEVKYLRGILAQNNAIQGKEKAEAVSDLTKEAVSGAGTDIEYLEQAILAINSPQDMKSVEAELKKYCESKGIKPKIAGQSYLQAILYDECDTFMGISTDHKEIRKFTEKLIKQGAYTPEQAVKVRAEQAAIQILEGDYKNVLDAVKQINDPQVLTRLDALLKTKKYDGLDGFLANKFKGNQTKQDLIKAELAANKLLSDSDAATVALRLIQNGDFNIRAKGLAAIRTNAQAQAVDKGLKSKNSSLGAVYDQFNKEKEEYKNKAKLWDGIAVFASSIGLGSAAEYISDKYRENTDVSDNLYVEADKPQNLTPQQKEAYELTVKNFEEQLEKMKADYQAVLDGQGVISGAVNEFCSIYNIGTTRDDIEARIEHDTETLRLLTLAKDGKLQKMVNGKPVTVSFEDVFKERQSEFITANAASISGVKNDIKAKPVTEFSAEKVAKVEQQGTTLAAMNVAKDYISQSWSELNDALNSSKSDRLTTAIYSSMEKLSQLSGETLTLDAYGLKMENGVIVNQNGTPATTSDLKQIAMQLKLGLSDISNVMLGQSLPMEANDDKVSKLLDKGFDSKLEQFKGEYREAYGQEPPEDLLESYKKTISRGTMVVNVGTAIGAVIAAPFTGGGSLAVFVAAAGATLLTQGLEQATDSNGWTNSEWTSTTADACWNGALAVVGMKVGMVADKAVGGGYKFATEILAKNEKIIRAIAPNISPEKLKLASIIVARAEATFGEVASDVLADLVQTYAMNGEFNEQEFTTNLLFSLAGNAAGHIAGAIGDAKAAKMDIEAGKVDVDVPKAEVDMNSPKVETSAPKAEVDMNSPKVEASTPKVDADMNSPKVETSAPKAEVDVNSPKVETSAPKAEVDVNSPKVETSAPKAEVDVNSPKVETSTPKVDADVASPRVDATDSKIEVKPASVVSPSITPAALPENANFTTAIMSNKSSVEQALKTADLTNPEVMKVYTDMLAAEFPAIKNYPKKGQFIMRMQELMNHPNYANLSDYNKTMAKLAILKYDGVLNPDDLYSKYKITVQAKRRIEDIEYVLKGGEAKAATAAALYHAGDLEVLNIINDVTKKLDAGALSQVDNAIRTSTQQGHMMVQQAHIVNPNQIPQMAVVKDGKTFNVRVIDLTDDNVLSNLGQYGFEPGTTVDDLRMTVHMNDDFNKAPRQTIGRMMNSRGELNLSASITDGTNHLYGDMQVGIVLDYDQGAISYASNYAAGTGFGKGRASFASVKLGESESLANGLFIRDRFIENMKACGVDVSVEDYAALSTMFKDKKMTKVHFDRMFPDGKISVNGKVFTTNDVQRALSQSSSDLLTMRAQINGKSFKKGFNEVNVYNPEIRAIYVRDNGVSSIEEILSADLLRYAQDKKIPIVFQRSKYSD